MSEDTIQENGAGKMEQDVFQMGDQTVIIKKDMIPVEGQSQERSVVIWRRRGPEKPLPVKAVHVEIALDHAMVVDGETFGEDRRIEAAKDKKGQQ